MVQTAWVAFREWAELREMSISVIAPVLAARAACFWHSTTGHLWSFRSRFVVDLIQVSYMCNENARKIGPKWLFPKKFFILIQAFLPIHWVAFSRCRRSLSSRKFRAI